MKTLTNFLLAMGLACSFAGSVARAEPPTPEFYETTGRIPPGGALGEIVAQAPVATAIAGAQAWRIAYISSDLADRKTVVTALVVAPAGPAPAAGRPVMAWAHGTTGTAQNCGPSQVLDPAVNLNEYFLTERGFLDGLRLAQSGGLHQQGYVVVGTDYQGLGGGGRHQYAVAATQARDVIDSIRAAASLTAGGAGKTAIVYGWSQGGGADARCGERSRLRPRREPLPTASRSLGLSRSRLSTPPSWRPERAGRRGSAQKLIAELTASFSDKRIQFRPFRDEHVGNSGRVPRFAPG